MKETLLTFSQIHWFSGVEAGPNIYYLYHLQASYMTENPTVLSRKPTPIKMTEKPQKEPTGPYSYVVYSHSNPMERQ